MKAQQIFCSVPAYSYFTLFVRLFFCLGGGGDLAPAREVPRNCFWTTDASLFSPDLDVLSCSSCVSVSLWKIPARHLWNPVESVLRLLREVMFPRPVVSACRGCALLPQATVSQPAAPHAVPLTVPSEPGLAARGPEGKGRLSVSDPCDICPAISLTISCLQRRLWHFFPTDPFRGEKDAPGRTRCFFASSFRAGRWS